MKSFWFSALQGAGKWRCYASAILFLGVFAAPAIGNTRFNLNDVSELAKSLAARPFKPPDPVPDFLKQLLRSS
jgi:glucan biosynthesis protein